MGRKTHGPYVVAAIDENDVQKLSNILSTKFRDKSKVKTFLASEVKRLASNSMEVPLLLAASLHDPTIIQYMVEKHDANINFVHEHGSQKLRKRTTPLLIAVKRGAYTTVDAISSLNANVNFQDHKGRSCLHHAIRRADYRMVKLLLSRGTQSSVVDMGGNSPLHVATIYGHSELIKLLIRYGGDLYKKGQHGSIPIHMAAREGHNSLIKMFCEVYEVNSNIRVPCYDELEKSPLHVAASQGHGETALIMIEECGADVNALDSEGNTPLHHTVLQEYDPLGMKAKDDITDTVKVLINKGCDVNIQNRRGETAMHLAARNEFQKVIEVLVLAGCDPLIEDNAKTRPLDLVDDDDTVSKQIIKRAIEDRNKFMYEAPKVRARGFMTNFQRGSFANASSHSMSLLNMTATNNQRFHQSFPNNTVQNLKGNLSAGTNPNSSSNSSKRHSRESINSGSKISHHTENGSIASRRVKSVENLDSRGKPRRKKQRDDFRSQYLRKNSYQDSEVTSMWDVTPPNSVSDLQTEMKFRENKKRKGVKQSFPTHKTIREIPERSNEADKYSASEEYYLDDDESMDDRLEYNRGHSKRRDNHNKRDRVNEWMDSQKNVRRHNTASVEDEVSEESETSYSDEESESDNTEEYQLRGKPSKPVPPPKPSKKNYRSNIEKVIELEVDDHDESGQTTIRVIPVNSPKSNRAKHYQEPVKHSKQAIQHHQQPVVPKSNESRIKSKTSKIHPSTSHHVVNDDSEQRPQPKKRNLKNVNQTEDVLSPPDANVTSAARTFQNKLEKDALNQKKSLIFEKSSVQPLDNYQHSNLARISAGEKAAPAKPTYSSSISPILLNNSLENSSKVMEQIQQNKFSNSSSSFNNSTQKIDNSNISWNALEESSEDLSMTNLKNFCRIISFANDDSLPFTLGGGNKTGIFVDAINQDSMAFKNGLLRGDKILKINDRKIFGRTKEEVDQMLRQIKGYVTMEVNNDIDGYTSLVDGDYFHVKALYSCEGRKKNDLSVNSGNVFLVIDTLPPSNKGYWMAKLISSKQEELKIGLIPNDQKAMQIVEQRKLLDTTLSSEKSGLKKKKKQSHMSSSDLTILGASEEANVYERVEMKKSNSLRPVVILGLFCEFVINRLIKEFPDVFEKAKESVETIINEEPTANVEVLKRYGRNKHLLCILSPPSIETLYKTSLSPIVIYLAPVNKLIVKTIRNQLAPNYAKDTNYMLDEALKFQENYKSLFSTVINFTTDDRWFYYIADFISDTQMKPVWLPVNPSDLESISLDESSKNFLDESNLRDVKQNKKKQRPAQRLSRTTDDLPEKHPREKLEQKIPKTTKKYPEITEKHQVHVKKSRGVAPTHETPL